jgi:hypothetical protein
MFNEFPNIRQKANQRRLNRKKLAHNKRIKTMIPKRAGIQFPRDQ